MSDRDGQQNPSSPGRRGGRTLSDQGEALAREFWDEVREGAQHFHLRGRQRPPGRVRQFFFGLSLPFHLARALMADPAARGRYLRVGLLQTVAALALALTCMGSGKEAVEKATEESRSRDQARALRTAAKALAAQGRLDSRTAQQLEEAQAQADQALREAGVEPPPALLGDAGTLAEAKPDGGVAETPEARVERRFRELKAAAGGDAGTSLPEAIAALALEMAALERDEDEDASEDEPGPAAPDGGTAVAAQEQPPRSGAGEPRPEARAEEASSGWRVKGFSVWDLAFWGALFFALQLAQWVVIALSRDYHDAISRDASLLTGVKPEDEEITPRVRLDVPWIRKKVKRRWRAFILFAVGLPVLWLFTVPFFCSSPLLSVLSSAWAGWWLVVFTAAKSSHAWEAAPSPRPPWFLRAWTWLTTQMPGFRWGLPRRYGAFLARRTQEVLAPIATAERHPWVFAGLTLMRFLGSFPPLKFFLRPLIPVAAAHLLAEEAAERAAIVPAPPRPVIPAGETGP